MRNISIVLLILLFAACGPYVPANLPDGYEIATVEVVVSGRQGCMKYLKVQNPGGEPYCMWAPAPCGRKTKVGDRNYIYNYSGERNTCSDVHRLEVKLE